MLHEMKLNKIYKNQNKISIGSPYLYLDVGWSTQFLWQMARTTAAHYVDTVNGE